MPESEHSQQNLASMRTHMERIEQLVRFQILANKQNADAVTERLSSRAGAAETYLAIGAGEKPQTQDELAAVLGKSQPTVSRILKDLHDAGLVIRVPSLTKVTAYAWSDLEPLLGVSRIAHRLVTEETNAQKKKAGARRRGSDGREIQMPRREDSDQLPVALLSNTRDDERDRPA
jgi:DNA-binding transcriptional ArsR family regulator